MLTAANFAQSAGESSAGFDDGGGSDSVTVSGRAGMLQGEVTESITKVGGFRIGYRERRRGRVWVYHRFQDRVLRRCQPAAEAKG